LSTEQKELAITVATKQAIVRKSSSSFHFTKSKLTPSLMLYAWRIATTMAVLCLATAYGFSQATNGTINGTLSDPTSNVISGAKVTLVNTGTAEARTATTNDSGFYQFDNLPPGQYRISVQQSGFKQLTRENIELQVDSTLRINLELSVGTATLSFGNMRM
jgi:hypothetical protein